MVARLHELHGLGYGARFHVSQNDLPPGWRQEKKSPKFTVWYDEKGNRYKFSLDVLRALWEREQEVNASEGETGDESGGETSEYETSSVKRPRIEVYDSIPHCVKLLQFLLCHFCSTVRCTLIFPTHSLLVNFHSFSHSWTPSARSESAEHRIAKVKDSLL